MRTRRLGRLGHESTVLIYGAAALGEVDQDIADRSIAEAMDAGINHIDVAAGYGEAELRLAPWMPDIRSRIFLATKTQERDADAAWRGINESLRRLDVDQVDLLQLHAVGDLAELDRCTRDGGSLGAAVRARDEGLVAAIGITGHGHEAPATHLEALRRVDLATVLTPWNYRLAQDPVYRASIDALVAEAQRQDAGLMVIKAVARRNWPSADAEHPRATWYEPFEEQERIDAAVAWVLEHEWLTGLATPGDVGLLGRVVAAERDWEASRTTSAAAADVLSRAEGYSSPFLDMPI